MPKEIERKFLVNDISCLDSVLGSIEITQAYLSLDPERIVRLRIKDGNAFLTIKGISDESGLIREEFETEIDLADPSALLALTLPGRIEKTRHHIPFNGHLIELDVFAGDNEGLLLAEIEFQSEEEALCFELPAYLGPELTGIKRYYNSALISHPYCEWTDEEKTGI